MAFCEIVVSSLSRFLETVAVMNVNYTASGYTLIPSVSFFLCVPWPILLAYSPSYLIKTLELKLKSPFRNLYHFKYPEFLSHPCGTGRYEQDCVSNIPL